jgi:GT2 family glycosyltransferase
MKLSVLIPTLGRSREVIDTVADLGRQTVLADEIVIVDQNEPPFAELDAALAANPRVRHIRSDTTGYAHNLNVCLREARGEIVVFLDDDVALDPKLLEMHLARYEDRGVSGVAGRVEQPRGDLPPERIAHVGRYSRWSGQVSGNFNALRPEDVELAAGGNMSFRREVLVAAGGFDAGFDGNGYRAETDACLRVVRAGHRLVFEPRATLRHLMAPAGGCRILDKSEHTYYFVKNGLRLYRRHSPALGAPAFALAMAGYALAKAAYNRDPKIATRGVRAVWDGLTQRVSSAPR